MGQKVSPTGLRIGINKDWESKWYAENDFAKYLNNDYKIRKYLNKKFKNANISKIIIERNAKRCEIFVYAAKPVAQNIAHQIENRVSFRVAQKKAIRNTMKAGAKGIKTLVSGRLGGADIARGEGYSEGTIPLHTLRADIDYATAEADTTYGKIGVKVWIYKGEILSKGGNSHVDAKKN